MINPGEPNGDGKLRQSSGLEIEGPQPPAVGLESLSTPEALKIADQLVATDPKFSDWSKRIHDRFDKEGNWTLEVVKTTEGQIIGFVLVSRSQEKMMEWKQKFQTKGWSHTPVDPEHSAQFVYFFIQPDSRNKGLGEQSLQILFDKLKAQGITTLYGFSRYNEPISLYLRTGTQIIGQNQQPAGIYYHWQL